MKLIYRLSQAAAGVACLLLAWHAYRIVPSHGPLARGLQFAIEFETHILLGGAVFFFAGIWCVALSLLDIAAAVTRPFEEKTAEMVRLLPPRWPFPVRKPPVDRRRFPPVYRIRYRKFG